MKILIVDDHPMVRSGLEAMLSAEDDMEVVGTVEGGDAAVEWCKQNKAPELVIADVHMPKGDGFSMLGAIKNAFPKTKVLMLAGMPLKEEEDRARTDGASGYLQKSIDGRKLVLAIGRLFDGKTKFVADAYTSNSGVLSERELQVLQYAAQGKTRDEIAIIIGIGSETVKSHLKSIMLKLDTTNTTSSVARGYELGILRA